MHAKFAKIAAVLMIAASLGLSGLALAHEPQGTPKNYCENPLDVDGEADHPNPPGGASDADTDNEYNTAETGVHEYGSPAAGFLTFTGPLTDGNLLGDCNGDGTPADYDQHQEFAHGGTYFLARSGYWNNSGVGGNGTVSCWGQNADHVDNETGVYVVDQLYGAAIAFSVTADWARDIDPNNDPTIENPCGDSLVEPCDPNDPTQIPDVTCNPRDFSDFTGPRYHDGNGGDIWMNYNDTWPGGFIPFPAGADGTYTVFIGTVSQPGTQGHIEDSAQVTLPDKKKNDESTALPVKGQVKITYVNGVVTVSSASGNYFRCSTNFDANLTTTWDVIVECGSSKYVWACGPAIAVHATGAPGAVTGQVQCDGLTATVTSTAIPPVASAAGAGFTKWWACRADFNGNNGVVKCVF